MEFRPPYDCIFSLGYRCSSAGILKSLGFKTESYPFDWMVSRLPLIENCIATDFVHFLNPNNYVCDTGFTNHYSSIDPSSRKIICKESICVNTHYEFSDNSDMSLYIPRPLSASRDVYGYKMMINHHNIKEIRNQEYFSRCVGRWKTIPNQKTLSFYIHASVFYEEFESIRSTLIDELRRSHKSIRANMKNDGIYVIPVKTPYEYPPNHCCTYVLEEQPDDESAPGCRICILWANRDFVDAGEIFMGNSYVETYVIRDYLMKTVTNNGLLELSST
jgi:hypothetical protein